MKTTYIAKRLVRNLFRLVFFTLIRNSYKREIIQLLPLERIFQADLSHFFVLKNTWTKLFLVSLDMFSSHFSLKFKIRKKSLEKLIQQRIRSGGGETGGREPGSQGDGRVTGDGRIEGGKREIPFIRRCKKM